MSRAPKMSEVEFACIDCGEKYPANLPRWRCACGGPLEVAPNGIFTRESLAKRPATLWRYREAIPIAADENIVSMNEGMTPLVPLDFSGAEILCKLDFLFPTGSFKDRGATVLMSKIKEWGLKQVLMDSSGNAAAADGRLRRARRHRMRYLRARLHLSGQMRANHRLWRESSQNTRPPGRLHRRRHGSGERALLRLSFLEPLVQPRNQDLGVRGVGATRLPSARRRRRACGHGSALIGAYLGFSELLRAGYIAELPKIFAAQAANCAPMVRMWEENLDAVPEVTPQDTIAEGISISTPVRWKQMREAARESGGCFIAVDDAMLPPLLREFGGKGILMEPTSAVAFAALALLKEQGKVTPSEIVVVPVTGHGLKAADKLEKIMSV